MDEKTKNESIEYILSQGLVKPQTAWERMVDMLRTLGLRFIFWDTGYSLFFTVITLLGVLTLFSFVPEDYRYSATIAVAPLFFLLIMMFVELSERAYRLYELKQTCRYTIYQISTLRVICYSVVGTVFTIVIAAMSADSGDEFLSFFPLCLSALFICAVLSVLIMRFSQSKWVITVCPIIWVFVNIALPFSLGEQWEAILRGFPVVLSIFLAMFGAAILIYQISKMLSEVKKHAIA